MDNRTQSVADPRACTDVIPDETMIKPFMTRWRNAPSDAPAPQPDRPLVVIGDVHGRFDLLEPLLERLARDPDLAGDRDLILAGDLMDRGPASAEVIDLARALEAEQPHRVTALMGNHEAMLIDFLDGKSRSVWLRAGGMDTLQSFGVTIPEMPPEMAGNDTDWLAGLRAAAVTAIGPTRIAWLRARPVMRQSGTVVAVHAAFDRTRKPTAQNPKSLLWGAKGFYQTHSTALPWVVHGHVITRPPRIEGTRIAIDSGAWLGGGLTAAVILPGDTPRLITQTD